MMVLVINSNWVNVFKYKKYTRCRLYLPRAFSFISLVNTKHTSLLIKMSERQNYEEMYVKLKPTV